MKIELVHIQFYLKKQYKKNAQYYIGCFFLKGIMMKKFAFVIGASGGIGSAIASSLAEDGYELFLHYYQNRKSVVELQQKLHEKGIKSYLVQGDLSESTQVEYILTQIHEPIDTFVYAAGESLVGLVTDFTTDEVHSLMNIHVTQLYLLANALIPSMVKRKTGNIIVISSIWGNVGASCEVLYSMTKGAQNAYVKSLAKELAPSNIRVNAVAPGVIDTKMMNKFTDEDREILKEEIPLGRFGDPNEIGEVVRFLASDKSSYITGEIITVSGGFY